LSGSKRVEWQQGAKLMLQFYMTVIRNTMATMEDDYTSDAGDIAVDELIDETTPDTAGAVTQDIAFKKLYQAHPECSLDYIESVISKMQLEIIPAGPRAEGVPVDKRHLSYPFLNKYEITKIIGHRANELSQGARPFINVPPYISDLKEIARMELDQQRLPYIIKRPMPNGTYEYWRLSDLIMLPHV
jgi:DNA-directed RNA polymerase I, II, and III subunit RPABC2